MRFAAGIVTLVLAGDEEVDGRIGKSENSSDGVEECEVELLAEATHVLGERHSSDKPSFQAPHVPIMVVGIVQVGECPRLEKSVTAEAILKRNSRRS